MFGIHRCENLKNDCNHGGRNPDRFAKPVVRWGVAAVVVEVVAELGGVCCSRLNTNKTDGGIIDYQ